MQLTSDLDACLREFAGSKSVEVFENGARVATFNGLSWELRGAPTKPFLRLWSDRFNLTRRVLAIANHSEQRLALAVECVGGLKPGRLEFIRLDYKRSARNISREEFCGGLTRILSEQFPDERVESLTVASDLEYSLSRTFARGLLRKESSHWAVLAVPQGQSTETAQNSLTFGLLWLDRARQVVKRGFIEGLRLIIPKGRAGGVAHLVLALRAQISVEIYELDPLQETVSRVDPQSAGNLETWLVPHREAQSLLDQANARIDPIVGRFPQAINIHPAVSSREVWLRFRGLACARWDDGNVFFGCGDAREKLTSTSEPAFLQFLNELEIHRHPLGGETRHSLYRQQPERWLESVVRKDVTRVDPLLDPRFVYTQVFASSFSEHGILDVLTVTRAGRLAILELKATEHIHLPLQAADYWLRIRRHLRQGDFPRYGYFAGIELQAAPPIVYLVAPSLHFHSTTDALLRHLSPEMEVIRVGLAESWRRELRVVMRQ